MNVAELDFQQLRIKHILYKSKVRSVLYVSSGVYDAAYFSSANPVTEWFHAIGLKKYRQHTTMVTLYDLQEDIQRTARHLFSLYQSGQIDLAQQGLSTIEEKSARFISQLSQLENSLRD